MILQTWKNNIWKIKAKITSKAFLKIATVEALSNLLEITSPIWEIKLKNPIKIKSNCSNGDSGRHIGEKMRTKIKHSIKPRPPNIVLITDQWISGINIRNN